MHDAGGVRFGHAGGSGLNGVGHPGGIVASIPFRIFLDKLPPYFFSPAFQFRVTIAFGD
jgi:hypothetical protein